MDFGHRITHVAPKLDILTCLFTHAMQLKAHTTTRGSYQAIPAKNFLKLEVYRGYFFDFGGSF